LGGELVPHVAQCCLDQGPLPCQVPSLSIQPFGHNGHGPKIGWLLPLFGEGSLFPIFSHLWSQSPGPRPTSVPSGILIHPATWLQQIWAENWGYPFAGGGVGSPSNTTWPGRGLPACKFRLDPSNCLATVYTNVTDRTLRQDNGLIA